MRNFFLTISLTVLALLLLLLYYAVKNYLSHKRQRLMAEHTWQKLYTDEIKYTQTHLRSLVRDLESGKIRWIVVHSKIRPEARFELTFTTIRSLIEIIFSGRELNQLEQKNVQKMGADRYLRNGNNGMIQCSVNSKIISDIIFYLLAEIYGLQKAKSLNIKVSGRI
jgi:hypothetical protein